MAERAIGSGVLLIDKPEGISSARALAILKRRLDGIRKIGHAGTLDPHATGLLVCFVNGATRLARYAESGRKIYCGAIRLGAVSDTDDAQGNVTEVDGPIPPFEQIFAVSREFVGEIEQVPPAISAIKIDGERAYRLARRGEQPKLRSRRVSIFRFEVQPDSRADLVHFEVECSKGTYVRSIARDLGERLGCGGLLHSLRRLASAPYHVYQAKRLDEATAEDVLAWESLFPAAETYELSDPEATKLRNGDQRTLFEVQSRLSEAAPTERQEGRHVICRERESGVAITLLVFEGGVWRVAANAIEGPRYQVQDGAAVSARES